MFSTQSLAPTPYISSIERELLDEGFDAQGKAFEDGSEESKMTSEERKAEILNCGKQINLIDIELKNLQIKMDLLKVQKKDLIQREHKLRQGPDPELQQLLKEIFPHDYKIECSKNISDKSCTISIGTTDQSSELAGKIGNLFRTILSRGEFMIAQPPIDLYYGYSPDTSYAIKVHCNDRAKVIDGLNILKAKQIPSSNTRSITVG